jgi:hypothetical protein
MVSKSAASLTHWKYFRTCTLSSTDFVITKALSKGAQPMFSKVNKKTQEKSLLNASRPFKLNFFLKLKISLAFFFFLVLNKNLPLFHILVHDQVNRKYTNVNKNILNIFF